MTFENGGNTDPVCIGSLQERVKHWLETQAAERIMCSLCGLPLSATSHVISNEYKNRLVCGHAIPLIVMEG